MLEDLFLLVLTIYIYYWKVGLNKASRLIWAERELNPARKGVHRHHIYIYLSFCHLLSENIIFNFVLSCSVSLWHFSYDIWIKEGIKCEAAAKNWCIANITQGLTFLLLFIDINLSIFHLFLQINPMFWIHSQCRFHLEGQS